ncbi:MAG: hypothetical protein HGGPFJEG_02998 [Ignavibacteria bacterium]|nr:hypothetical protein [Ignavibacteria bacterium]
MYNIISRVFLILVIILEFFNLSVFNSRLNEPIVKYHNITVIRVIDIGSTIVNLALIISIWVNMKREKSNRAFFHTINVLFSITLLFIWFEIIYSSIYYYGGIGNHQGLPTDVNNLGLFGSVIIFQYFFNLLTFNQFLSYFKIIIYNIVFLLINILLHYQLLKLLTPL